ncbi:MAG: glycosyltransferase family 39 protein, partial [Nitratireductor sp.]|nr:glycosyltransferase family 39 protein [Nitratireductor sp.]
MKGRSWQRLAIIVLGAILAARIVSLWFNNTELFFDEAQYWAWGKEPAFGYFSKPPLLAWIIGLVTAIFGNSEFA